MLKILFICMGNICRSPMAEAVFNDLVDKAGLGDRIKASSAGVGPWHVGEPAHSGTLRVLHRHGLTHHGRARQITRADMDEYDLILAMDSDVLASLERRSSGYDGKIGMFLAYAHEAGAVATLDVPDPYYSGEFESVYDLVTKGCAALLNHLRAAHHL